VEEYPIKFSAEYPECLSRGILLLRTFLGWLYCGLPHGIVLLFYSIAVGVVSFIAWWAILFTGRYPRGMYDFMVGFNRWSIRVGAYMSYLTDKYPPFSGQE